MATALMGGITSATVLTLFFLPALYAAWFRVKRRARGSTTMTTVKSPRTPARLAVLPLVLALGACAFAPTASRPRAQPPVRRAALPAAARRRAWPSL